MHIYLDNTGFGLAGSVLLRDPCANINDIEAFINLCTLVVFSEKIRINGYDIESTIDLSLKTINQLKKMGIDNDLLDIGNLSPRPIMDVCDYVAQQLSQNLNFEFNPEKEHNIDGTTSRSISPERMKRQTEYMSMLLMTEEERKNYAYISIMNEGMYGAVNYVFGNESFFDTFKRYIKKHPSFCQNSDMQYLLNVLIRYRINESFAERQSLYYSPSLQRARLVKDIECFYHSSIPQYTIQSLNKVLTEISNEYLQSNQEIIPITKYLLEKSNLNPFKMIEESIKLRFQAEPIRKLLTKSIDCCKEGKHQKKLLIDKELKELSRELRCRLGIKDTVRINDTISAKVAILDKPDISVDMVKLEAWLKEKYISSRKLNVFTEISTWNIFASSQYSEMELMRRMLELNV